MGPNSRPICGLQKKEAKLRKDKCQWKLLQKFCFFDPFKTSNTVLIFLENQVNGSGILAPDFSSILNLNKFPYAIILVTHHMTQILLRLSFSWDSKRSILQKTRLLLITFFVTLSIIVDPLSLSGGKKMSEIEKKIVVHSSQNKKL